MTPQSVTLTLSVETGEKHVPPTVTCHCAGTSQHVGELVREVDCHGVHPEEEADKGVVDGVAEEVADGSEENLGMIRQGKAPLDPKEKEVEAAIEEESHHYLAEKILPQLGQEEIDDEGHQEE